VEDIALLTDLGAQGLEFIPVYSAVLKEIARLSRFQTLGITKGLRMEVFAIKTTKPHEKTKQTCYGSLR
jgi:hypothetical protein